MQAPVGFWDPPLWPRKGGDSGVPGPPLSKILGLGFRGFRECGLEVLAFGSLVALVFPTFPKQGFWLWSFRILALGRYFFGVQFGV